MKLYQAVVLGLIQGLTELLPISSSAHLNLIPQIFYWNIPESFDVALHFGTLLAITVFFWNDWIELLKGGYRKIVKKEDNFNGRLLICIVIATIPGGAIGFILDKYAGSTLNKPVLIAVSLIVIGIVLYFVDKKSKSKYNYSDLNIKNTFVIGLSQALAFIPGVSRSGITMISGRLMGLKREDVAKFSFILSMPIVLGASLYKFLDFQFSVEAIVGIIVSFLSGMAVIKFLLNYLKNKSFKVFAVYRILVGIAVLMLVIYQNIY